VMVEPPRHLRRIRILEIDNRILVAIEQSRFPRLLRAVRHARETKLCVRIKFFAVKTVKKGSRSVPSKQRSWKQSLTRVIFERKGPFRPHGQFRRRLQSP